MDRALFLLALAGLFAYGLLDNARGPLFPDLLAALRLSDTAGSLMFALGSVGTIGAMVALPAVVRRVGALTTLRLALGGAAAATFAYGTIDGLLGLVVASLGFGLALGSIALTTNLLVEQAAGAGRRRRALAVLHATYGLASLSAPLFVSGAKLAGFAWRGVFAAAATLPLALVAGALLLRRPERAARPEAPGLPGREELLVGIMLGCAVAGELIVSTRLVLLLERSGRSPEVASLALSGFFVALLAGRIALAAAPSAWSGPRLLALSALASALIYAVALGFEPLLLVAVGFTIGPFFPLTMDLLAERFPQRLEEAFASAHLVVSVLLVIAHTAVGALSDWIGLRHACLLGILTLSLAAALALRGRGRRA